MMIHTLHGFATGYVCATLTPGNLIASSYTSSTLANAAMFEDDVPSRPPTLTSSTNLIDFVHRIQITIFLFGAGVFTSRRFTFLSHKSLTSKYTSTWLVPQGMELPEEKQPGHHKRFERVAFKLILESNLSLEFTLPWPSIVTLSDPGQTHMM